ncbi:Putative NADPH-quinone reductase (modulator of drug activity B) [Limimonas halophila]|uniref:Putative NADPH-quinone reductase (Modulator of drug activity B) n=1 Tax=Limimonas halophila TaxID=1082479 RepID=A0A1G7N3Z7_9PROT|nr:NAD(P)H-dependent oxidoreductase [Limimonas halophila]SDF68734.1 Putative NADPH-quinone reductase (modulator of drug activity B) [Limimonas halophila]
MADPTRILIIQGHPDPAGGHYGHALAHAYAEGAEAGGHTVERVAVAELDFPLVRSQQDFTETEPPAAIAGAQAAVERAQHIVLIYPLWLGTMPALLKGFLEQVFRPGFAFSYEKKGFPNGRLTGRSARVVVTMGMPAFAYRWWFGAHSLRSLERNILKFCGIGPVRDSLVGSVDSAAAHREKWLARMRGLGRAAR